MDDFFLNEAFFVVIPNSDWINREHILLQNYNLKLEQILSSRARAIPYATWLGRKEENLWKIRLLSVFYYANIFPKWFATTSYTDCNIVKLSWI